MKRRKKKSKNKKTIPLNPKTLGVDIAAYPFVEIKWWDIEGDAGWSDTKSLNKEKLPAEDVNFIEQEFNDYMLEDGYKSLFRFPKFKEFIKSVTIKEN